MYQKNGEAGQWIASVSLQLIASKWTTILSIELLRSGETLVPSDSYLPVLITGTLA
jgi:hypothetical protein